MDLPLVVGPMERGREILSSLAPVKRPDLDSIGGPVCSQCGTTLSNDVVETMDVHGIKYCPVCVLEDVHPFADPFSLLDSTTKDQLRSQILDTFGPPPEEVRQDDTSLPGVYILWSPPREDRLEESLNLAQKFGNLLVSVLSAATGNGLLYVGQSQDVASRVWNHSKGGASAITTLMAPTRLVAVNWKPPNIGLRDLENRVGRQVSRSVQESGYDMEVYWN